jgi:carnitine 3-dehydrogenase
MTSPAPHPIQTVAVIGCGSIGASWAALFAHHGLRTIAYDPNPEAEVFLRRLVQDAEQIFAALGSAPSAGAAAAVQFTTDLATALRDADVVQENGPEDVVVKKALLATIDAACPGRVLVLTSTSGLTCSAMAEAFGRHPARFAVGHPFNPPHLIPLVEVVGGPATSASTIHAALAFYTRLGKKPIHVKKEVSGHIANRLQATLFQEIMYLLKTGVATVADIETAMQYGPGLRWGVMGPSTLFHLGGGAAGGAEHFSSHILRPMLEWTAKHGYGEPVMDEETRKRWVRETEQIVEGQDFAQLSQRRDEGIVEILKWRARMDEQKE